MATGKVEPGCTGAWVDTKGGPALTHWMHHPCPVHQPETAMSQEEVIADLRARLAAAQDQAGWATAHLGKVWAAVTGGREAQTLSPEEVMRVVRDIVSRLRAAEREKEELKRVAQLAEQEAGSILRERDAATARAQKAEEELRAVRDWEDVDDEWSAAIKEAHPTRSGSHAEYTIAMKMVGHRHSRGELVSLVNWLLLRIGGQR